MKHEDSSLEESFLLQRLANLRWRDGVTCYRCHSKRCSYMESEGRYHCHVCCSSFSATAGTVFHNTRIPFLKWVEAIRIVSESRVDYIGCRKLAVMIGVHKNTANRMLNRIRRHWHDPEARKMMLAFSEEYEL